MLSYSYMPLLSPLNCSVSPPKRSRGKPALAKIPNNENGDITASGVYLGKKNVNTVVCLFLFLFKVQWKYLQREKSARIQSEITDCA